MLTSQELEVAQRIANKYGAVLEEVSVPERPGTPGVVLPESLLPDERERIKQALKLCLLSMLVAGRNRDESWGAMRFAYSLLPTFIPDADAKLVSKGMEALQSGDPQHKDQRHVDRALEIQEEVLKQSQDLLRELDDFPDEWSKKLKKT